MVDFNKLNDQMKSSSFTRSSAFPSEDADNVILISKAEELDKQGLVSVDIIKARNSSKGTKLLRTSCKDIDTMTYEPQ